VQNWSRVSLGDVVVRAMTVAVFLEVAAVSFVMVTVVALMYA
jgi:hypothetical protein